MSVQISSILYEVELLLSESRETSVRESERRQNENEMEPNEEKEPLVQFPVVTKLEERSREERASCLSNFFFSWLSPLINLPLKERVEIDILGNISAQDKCETNYERLVGLWENEKKRKGLEKASLQNIFYEMIGYDKVFYMCFLYALQITFSIFPPLLTQLLINHVSGISILSNLYLGLTIAAVFVCPIIVGFCQARFQFLARRTAIHIYSALTVAIYRKSLLLSSSAKSEAGAGKIVNLMTSDASKNMERSIELLFPLYILPLQFIVSFFLITQYLSYAMITAVVIIIATLPLNTIIFMNVSSVYTKAMEYTDKRVKLVNEFLNGIRIVKFYAWEVPFVNRITLAREEELKFIKKHAYWSMMGLMTVYQQIPSLLQLGAFMTYALLGGHITPSTIFVSLQLFQLLQTPLTQVPSAISTLIQRRVALERITVYMKLEEIAVSAGDDVSLLPPSEGKPVISMDNGEFTWSQEVRDAALKVGDNLLERKESINEMRRIKSEKEMKGKKVKKNAKSAVVDSSAKKKEESSSDFISTLSNININIQPRTLVALVGSVGSGKSTLLYSILRESLKIKGVISVRGTCALAEQQAWIMNATVKDNILFGLDYDEKRYNEVVKACALESDFKQFIGGDSIQIGERGINLSGGQKARINLARAVYSNADILLLDDPLAAVDTHVSDHLFNECIKKKLSNKTVILVTNQLHRLKNVDHIIYLENNTIAEQGTFQELMELEGIFHGIVNRLDINTNISAALVDNSSDNSPTTSKDKDPSPIVKKEEAKTLMQEEERASGLVSWSAYVFYMKAVGLCLFITAGIFNTIGSTAVFSLCSNFVLAAWANVMSILLASSPFPSQMTITKVTDNYLTFYAICIGVGVFLNVTGSFFAIQSRVVGSRNLHAQMITGVTKAPISYYDVTPLGRILNRFSNDMFNIDYTLTMMLMFTVVIFMGVVVAFLALAITTKGIMLILIVPLFIFYLRIAFLIQSFQIKVQRLESICRSPIYSNFTEVLYGLSTMRAYNQVDRFKEINRNLLNTQITPYLMSSGAIPAWLTLRLNIIGAIMNLAVSLLAVFLPNIMNPAELGLALTYSITVVQSMNFFIVIGTQVQSLMNNVERVKFLGDGEGGIPVEAPANYEADYKNYNGDVMQKVNKSWPSAGTISFQGLAMGYRDGPDVLKDLKLNIPAGTKVGIVGRTGSGKSSLMIALFRINEARRGKIIIDGIDIATVGLTDLRSRIGIIPQDPVVFLGTVRYNLDPFDNFSDEEIWTALEHVRLKDFVSNLENGLMTEAEEGGSNFSVGQRQLMCIARALLRDPKVLVLDEATASIDTETDKILQSMVRKNFRSKTVLTIAHRLDSIMDSDMILVMDAGYVAEYDTPANLLKVEGVFKSLVYADGEEEANRLKNLVQKN